MSWEAFDQKYRKEIEEDDGILAAVDAFINTDTAEEARKVIDDNPSLVRSFAADQLLALLLANTRVYGRGLVIYWKLNMRRKMLARIRSQGVTRAFASPLPDSFSLSELSYFQRPITLSIFAILASFFFFASLNTESRAFEFGLIFLTFLFFVELLIGYHLSYHFPILAKIRIQRLLTSIGSCKGDYSCILHVIRGRLFRLNINRWPEVWGATNAIAATHLMENPSLTAMDIEEGIAYLKLARLVFDQVDEFPWGSVHNSLGNAYLIRLYGDRVQNIEKGIKDLEVAEAFRTREADPTTWATTQANLGIAYGQRILGDKEHNTEEAIRHLEQALTAGKHLQENPRLLPSIYGNLGNAYRQRTLGNSRNNFLRARTHFESALQILTDTDDRPLLADTRSNYGYLLIDHAGSEVADFEEATTLFLDALTFYDSDSTPSDWARTQEGLAVAYSKTGSIKDAIKHYRLAQTVFTSERSPTNHLNIKVGLGDQYFQQGEYSLAITEYEIAIELRKRVLSKAYVPNLRQERLTETSRMFANAAYCLCSLGRVARAVEISEQGKTFILANALALSETNLALLPQQLQSSVRENQRQRLIVETQIEWATNHPNTENDLPSQLGRLRGLNDRQRELLAEARSLIPEFTPEGITLSSLFNLIPESGAIVIPIISVMGSYIIVVPSGAGEVDQNNVVGIPDLTATQVIDWWAKWSQVIEQAADQRKSLLDQLTQALWNRLMGPVAARIRELGVPDGAEILFFPSGELSVLPYAAANANMSQPDTAFNQIYVVLNSFSGFSTQHSKRRLAGLSHAAPAFLAVANPDNDMEDLPFAVEESQQIARFFPQEHTKVLLGPQATLSSVIREAPDASYLHFACHGKYSAENIMKAALFLAGQEELTVENILTDLTLPRCKLVTLSSCESGLTDTDEVPNEFLGLPASFLQAGAVAIISTLWPVNDLSTMLLMEKLYELHRRQGLALPIALQQAQRWLFSATAEELRERFGRERQHSLNFSDLWRHFVIMDPTERPFAHPDYWAAFTYIGP
jgi:CHAT domain-containing protein